ncbi:alanine racemase [Streptomyces sulfonofaciens]|uniref:Alanine racemase n=1 Tax=Streptomyces sulfonofaciens TaxID=68272 RepID=A0A919GE42_9ACTN|nr:LacI family DNA-binding transcriptional regulator [Streptomyces sulfonofaciens]GHH82366.1 alanine racemase [Streptomyces sulfonofaciens]
MAEQERPDVATAVQPTLVDVAVAAGVSRQTVSNVLHAPGRVRAETRERVEHFIAKLGYQPNRVAQDLRANASRMIGYRIRPLAPGALASIHDRFLHALAEAGRAADHHLLLFTADDGRAEAEAAARLRRSGGAAGFVLYDVTADDARPDALLGLGVPFVAFGRTAQGTDRYAWVDVDNPAGTAAAVDHLVHRGHRRIGYVGWPAGDTVGDRRAQGWQAAIERHGLTAECRSLDVRGEDSVTAGTQMAYALLARPEPPTAVVTATDTLAVGVLRAAQQWGLEVGRDIAVVGFDDTPTAAALDLSSVRQPIELVGRHVMSTLLDATSAVARPRPSASTAPSTERLLAPRLIIRSSSASPAPAHR